MEDRKITVTIDPIGNAHIEAHGFSGDASCAEATKKLEEALSGGGQVQKTYKEEWSQQNADGIEIQNTRW